MDKNEPRRGDDDRVPDVDPAAPDADPAAGPDPAKPDPDPVWEGAGEETMDQLMEQASPSDPAFDGGGMIIYTDEHGNRRRLPAERGTMSSAELRAAANALHRDLGGPAIDYARVSVIERLNELRASGRMSE